jgi:hypothetical protein
MCRCVLCCVVLCCVVLCCVVLFSSPVIFITMCFMVHFDQIDLSISGFTAGREQVDCFE